MRRNILLLLVLFVMPSVAQATEASTILKASAGIWEGELYYLDYQSGQRFGIPMRVEASVTPDGATLVRRLIFTDPGVLVHAINLATIDRDTGELVESYFREGRGELSRSTIVSAEFTSESEWRLVYELGGTDGGKPARIRHTVVRDGRNLTSKKEVRFIDGGTEYFERNGSETIVECQRSMMKIRLQPRRRSANGQNTTVPHHVTRSLAIPTPRIHWDQPHEGNLFEHLYKQRAFQMTA